MDTRPDSTAPPLRKAASVVGNSLENDAARLPVWVVKRRSDGSVTSFTHNATPTQIDTLLTLGFHLTRIGEMFSC